MNPPGNHNSDDDGLLTQASIIEKLGAGDSDEAWNRFYRIYREVIIGTAKRWELGEAACQDVVQEVMLAVNRISKTLTYDRENRIFIARPGKANVGRGGFRQWLFIVIKRAIWKQKYGRRKETSFTDHWGEDEEQHRDRIPSEEPQPDAAMDEKSEEDYLMALLEQSIRLLPACTRRSHPRKIAIFLALKQWHVFRSIIASPASLLPEEHMREMKALAKLPGAAAGEITKSAIMDHYGMTSNHVDQEVKAIKEKLMAIFSDLRSGRDPLNSEQPIS